MKGDTSSIGEDVLLHHYKNFRFLQSRGLPSRFIGYNVVLKFQSIMPRFYHFQRTLEVSKVPVGGLICNVLFFDQILFILDL